ncbi:hypothetical protein BDP67DRAFT_496337 [Colletotrichum lupini]|nr:hypothetical protein BDP67DRAFT_496337 [Colletotrichum lupini]
MKLYVLAGSPSWLAPPQSNVLGRSDGVVPKSQGKVVSSDDHPRAICPLLPRDSPGTPRVDGRKCAVEEDPVEIVSGNFTVQRNEPSRVGAAAARGTLGCVNHGLDDVPSLEARLTEQGGLEFDNDTFVDELAIRSIDSQNNSNAGHPHAELAPHDTSSPVTPNATKRLRFLFQHLSTFSYYLGKFSLAD